MDRVARSVGGGRDVEIGRAISKYPGQTGRGAQALSRPGGRRTRWARGLEETHANPTGSSSVMFCRWITEE